jgi:quinol monooxygenase YgiN
MHHLPTGLDGLDHKNVSFFWRIRERKLACAQRGPFFVSTRSKQMIRHVVMWKLKDHAENAGKAENAARMKALLDGCAAIVPGILKYETGIAAPEMECSYDVVLYSEFESRAALEAYNAHPAHQALKPFVAAVREARQSVDYEA